MGLTSGTTKFFFLPHNKIKNLVLSFQVLLHDVCLLWRLATVNYETIMCHRKPSESGYFPALATAVLVGLTTVWSFKMLVVIIQHIPCSVPLVKQTWLLYYIIAFSDPCQNDVEAESFSKTMYYYTRRNITETLISRQSLSIQIKK